MLSNITRPLIERDNWRRRLHHAYGDGDGDGDGGGDGDGKDGVGYGERRRLSNGDGNVLML